MGSVRFDGEDELQPSTSDGKNYKASRKLFNNCGAFNCASVPRKLRSAIKKGRRESISLPFAIPRKQRRVSNGVEKLRENGVKKSRMVMKQGRITKDEEEVAETLNALADMFADVAKTNKPVLDGEPSKIKSSTLVEAGSLINAAEDSMILKVQEESGNMNTRVTLEAACHYSAEVENLQSLDDVKQPEIEFSKQLATPSESGNQSYLSLGPRPKMSGPDMIPVCERMIVRNEVSAAAIQYGKYHYTKKDKYKGLSLLPSQSSKGAFSSETHGSCLGSSANIFPAWSENTYNATQPSVNGSSFSDKIRYSQSVLEPKKSWKRCSAHVCIARLIKVLQKSEVSKGLLVKPTQLTTSGGVEQGLHVSVDNRKGGIDNAHDVLAFNGFAQPASEMNLADVAIGRLSHQFLHQDQQLDSKTSVICSSVQQGSEFLALAAGGSGTSKGTNRSGYGREAMEQFHTSYRHPRNISDMHFPLPQNGYSSIFGGRTSAEAAPQVQLPPYLSNNFGSSVVGHISESQQQKWSSQVQSGQHLPDWQSRGRDSTSMLNYGQALFPHMHSALGSKYQHFSPPQLQLTAPVNSSLALSNVERHHRHLNPALERNGATLYSDNIQQMRLLCNRHL